MGDVGNGMGMNRTKCERTYQLREEMSRGEKRRKKAEGKRKKESTARP
jgi:hypothetical protein